MVHYCWQILSHTEIQWVSCMYCARRNSSTSSEPMSQAHFDGDSGRFFLSAPFISSVVYNNTHLVKEYSITVSRRKHVFTCNVARACAEKIDQQPHVLHEVDGKNSLTDLFIIAVVILKLSFPVLSECFGLNVD